MLLISQLLVSALFGSMVFFSFVMAPLIFTQLEEATAGRFIRAVFPWYYLVLLSLSLLAGIAVIAAAPLESGVLLGVASLAIYARQYLMPRVNHYRDRSLAGDEQAGRRFDQLHRVSVMINGVQLIAVTLAALMLLGQ